MSVYLKYMRSLDMGRIWCKWLNYKLFHLLYIKSAIPFVKLSLICLRFLSFKRSIDNYFQQRIKKEQWGFFSLYIISSKTSFYLFFSEGGINADDMVKEVYCGGDLNIQPSACTLAINIILYNIAVVKRVFDHIKIVTDTFHDLIVVWLLVS